MRVLTIGPTQPDPAPCLDPVGTPHLVPHRHQVAAEGETYYRYGVMLKKVANFYNNMSSQVCSLVGEL